ncbi:hypothetical protein D3C71_1822370 [compost metagenome]
MLAQRDLVPNGSATVKALDYIPIGNKQVESQIRPWALGRSNCLFPGRYAAETYHVYT